MTEDTFLKTLTALEAVLADNATRTGLIKRRIDQLRESRSRGVPYKETFGEDEPVIVQLLTESATALDICGADVRRAEAQALYAEGLTMEQIGALFGVTRQRVSALLRRARA